MRISVEGKTQGDWVLIDASDVIVHLFRLEVRAYYNLEKMWGEALPDSEAARQSSGTPPIRTRLLAIGKLRKGPFAELQGLYAARILPPPSRLSSSRYASACPRRR